MEANPARAEPSVTESARRVGAAQEGEHCGALPCGLGSGSLISVLARSTKERFPYSRGQDQA